MVSAHPIYHGDRTQKVSRESLIASVADRMKQKIEISFEFQGNFGSFGIE